MSIDGTAEDDQSWDFDEDSLDGLPDYENLGHGMHEYNTANESDVREIIESAAEDGDRISITIFDTENGVALDLFDYGMSADYLLSEIGQGNIAEYLAGFSGGVIDAEDIGFFQIHQSGESTDLTFE